MFTPPTIVWFRRDLRLDDNPALTAAARTGQPVIPVYIFDTADPKPPGGAAKWWLHGSLVALSSALARRGLDLILLRGDPETEILRLADETRASRVMWVRAYDPHAVSRDTAVKKILRIRGINAESFGGALLKEPRSLMTAAGGPYQVFTAFYRSLAASDGLSKPLPPPGEIRPFTQTIPSNSLSEWTLRPTAPDWASGFREAWTPGEDGARRALLRFVDETMAGYARDRDIPSKTGTSRLAPHLTFGEIGPARLWHTLSAHPPGPGRDAALRQLAWREFSHHLLFHRPDMADRPLKAAFDRFPWRDDQAALKVWRKGCTGYPIVDAGMRELWSTGWMHNRVRMIVASFLTKHLRIDWRVGASWFWDTLVDADLANNAANWQWVAGSGADAAPYFRIFNPVLQGQKFDPEGVYVRRWVPELADVPAAFVHCPWRASVPPVNYPPPIVDHAAARASALAAYRSIRS